MSTLRLYIVIFHRISPVGDKSVSSPRLVSLASRVLASYELQAVVQSHLLPSDVWPKGIACQRKLRQMRKSDSLRLRITISSSGYGDDWTTRQFSDQSVVKRYKLSGDSVFYTRVSSSTFLSKSEPVGRQSPIIISTDDNWALQATTS